MALERDYDIIARLGEGAFGKVYQATHRASGDTVAVKQIKLGSRSWDDALKSTELAALRALRHNFIVRLRELLRSPKDGSLYYVFEFVGSDLFRLLRKHPQGLPEQHAAELQRQIFAGLAHIHLRNFFHRDIKPENILYDEASDSVRIADFGEARSLRARPPFTDYVGTRWYRAPECLLRDRSYSSPVDVWASGLVFCELLRGTALFCGTSSIDQLYKVLVVLGQPPSTEWPEFSRLAEAVRFRVPDGPGCGLDRVLPKTSSSAAVSFAAEVLKLNPRRRPLARKCLEHSFFSRMPSLDVGRAEAFRVGRSASSVGFGADDQPPDTSRSQASGVSSLPVGPQVSGGSGNAGPGSQQQQQQQQHQQQQQQQQQLAEPQERGPNARGSSRSRPPSTPRSARVEPGPPPAPVRGGGAGGGMSTETPRSSAAVSSSHSIPVPPPIVSDDLDFDAALDKILSGSSPVRRPAAQAAEVTMDSTKHSSEVPGLGFSLGLGAPPNVNGNSGARAPGEAGVYSSGMMGFGNGNGLGVAANAEASSAPRSNLAGGIIGLHSTPPKSNQPKAAASPGSPHGASASVDALFEGLCADLGVGGNKNAASNSPPSRTEADGSPELDVTSVPSQRNILGPGASLLDTSWGFDRSSPDLRGRSRSKPAQLGGAPGHPEAWTLSNTGLSSLLNNSPTGSPHGQQAGAEGSPMQDGQLQSSLPPSPAHSRSNLCETGASWFSQATSRRPASATLTGRSGSTSRLQMSSLLHESNGAGQRRGGNFSTNGGFSAEEEAVNFSRSRKGAPPSVPGNQQSTTNSAPWSLEESSQLRKLVKRIAKRGNVDKDALWLEVSRELGGVRGPTECKKQYARDYKAHKVQSAPVNGCG